MIPKIIHYVRFGDKEIPKEHQTYIGWRKKILPNYKFILWNEDNFDVNMSLFTKQVAEKKKRWFIVDYIRAYVVYNYWGIYLDTDVELLKSLDPFLHHECFSWFEDEKYVNPWNIFWWKKWCAISRELLDFYSNYEFVDKNWDVNLTPSPKIFTKLLMQYGLKQNNKYQDLWLFTAYSTEYFCPKSYATWEIHITKKTVAIHHYAMSWVPLRWRVTGYIIRIMNKIFWREFTNNILNKYLSIKSLLFWTKE